MKEFVLHGLESLGLGVRSGVTGVGSYALMVKETFSWMFRRPFRVRLIFKQLEFVGNQSFFIVFLASLFVGAVLGLQVGKIFGIFRAEGLMGAAVAKSMALELGPVMCGFIVTGRAGAAMAAEIATMRVNEQLDAMEAMGVDPVSYLVAPRVLASLLMMPILSGMFLFVGVIGAYIIGLIFFSIDTQVFINQLVWLVWMQDVFKGLFKATMFGFILSTVACYKGYNAKGGAKGVGDATTSAVVTSLLSILISDFFVSLFQAK